MNAHELNTTRILKVARALGEDLLERIAFVGGSTTGLLITDPVTRQQVRHTEDVDVIVQVVGYSGWMQLQKELGKRGFTTSPQDEVFCRMRLNEIMVDFMPDDETLGFTNRWYALALQTANPINLSDNQGTASIRLVSPACFIGSKLEAWLGRGNNDPLVSHDLEDLLNVFDGRPELIADIRAADHKLQQYIQEQLQSLLKHPDFEYTVLGMAGNVERAEIIFQRIETVIQT